MSINDLIKRNKALAEVNSQLIQQLKVLSKSNLDYQTTQHNRDLAPSLVIANNGFTAGVNNCYFLTNVAAFGTSSKTNNSPLWVTHPIPSDYVSGQDLTLDLWIRMAGGANPDTVDYKVVSRRIVDGSVIITNETLDATWTENFTGSKIHKETLTIDGTNINAGEQVLIEIYMEDDDNVNNMFLYGYKLIVPVIARV